MPRKRDGFVPLGDVAEAVELSGRSRPDHQRRRVAGTTFLHPARPGDAARERERSRSGTRLHGAATRALLAAAHQQPRRETRA